MSVIPPTKDEWLRALQDVQPVYEPDPNALTLQEFATMLGCANSTATKRLAALIAAGRAERTSKTIRRSNGSVLNVTAYRLVTDDPA